MDIRSTLRLARALPPRVVLRKVAGRIEREATRWTRLAADIVTGSHGADRPQLNPHARIDIAANDIPSDLAATLRIVGAHYLQHRFDLLGSGWVSPIYGYEAHGFLGARYPSRAPKAPGRGGTGLTAIVNRSNVARAGQIWRLLSGDGYAPIDWQLDFRSGYRWTARRPATLLPMPIDSGADVKVPWELGRLQHLPQLALCAILAAAGTTGFERSQRYLTEISDQLVDFIATNPPRFGVNWMGAMDVGIRAANVALTLGLLRGADLALPPEIVAIIAASLDDHAAFVSEHLEYSETGRSNHYLADLGGLVWAGWAMSGETSACRLVFAIAELLAETDNQFLPDGGNYEGSTAYHRLSAEIVLFSLALILSLDEAAMTRLEQATPPRRRWRAAFPTLPLPRYSEAGGGAGIVAPALLRKLQGAAHLARAVQGADATIAQIGDTDSGRFFKLHPTALPLHLARTAGDFVENTLDASGLIEAVDVLFGAQPKASLDGVLVHRLMAGAGPPSPPMPVTRTR